MRIDHHIKRSIESYTFKASKQSKHEALDSYSMAYTQAKELGNPFTLRACAANLGAMYVSLGTTEEAEKGIEYLENAIPPDGKSDGASNGDIYYNIALGYEVMKQNKKAAHYFEKAYKEYKKERENTTMELDTLKRLVQVNTARQQYTKVVNCLKELEQIYERSCCQKDQVLIMMQRISLQHKLNQEEVTEEVVEECLKMLQAVREQDAVKGDISKMIKNEVGFLVQVSVMLTQLKKYDKAQKCLEEAQTILEEEDSLTLEQAMVMQNLGTVFNFLLKFKKSIPYHKKAASIYHHYACLPPDPISPIQPVAAQRCQGHCLANYAFAMANIGDVDEARVQFDKARELAENSGDFDTVCQMDEALGAVHFQLACSNVNLPQPLTENTRVVMTRYSLQHLKKSSNWYKKAFKDLARASRENVEGMESRVMQKLTQLCTFKTNCTLATTISHQPGPGLKAIEKPSGNYEDDNKSTTDYDDDDDEDEEEDDDDDDDDEDDSHNSVQTEDEDDDRTLLKEQYRQHLKKETQYERNAFHQPVSAVVDGQNHKDPDYSSSEEDSEVVSSTNEDSNEEDEDDDDEVEETSSEDVSSSEEEDVAKDEEIASSSNEDSLSEGQVVPDDGPYTRKRGAPPTLPTSPPGTMKHSGTYEIPIGTQDKGDRRTEDETAGPSSSVWRQSTGTGDYAEIDFNNKPGDNPPSSNDEDKPVRMSSRKRKTWESKGDVHNPRGLRLCCQSPSTTTTTTTTQDQTLISSTQDPSASSPDTKNIGFRAQNKEGKESKTCIIM